MQAVAVILVLAVITGCHARSLPQDQAMAKWEDTVNRFSQYISQLGSHAEGVMDSVKSSQLSRELDTLITDTMAELNVYKQDVETRLAPYTEETVGKFNEDMQLLVNRLLKDMTDGKERSTQYAAELRSMLEQNAEDVRNRVNTYVRKMKKRLNKDTEDIRGIVNTYMGELQSRTSQNVDAVKDRFEPYVSQVRDGTTQKLVGLTELLKDQAHTLSQQLESQAGGLKEQLEQTAEELRTSLDGKIDELTDLLSPYTEKIRDQLQAVMEKIKEATAALPA